MTPLSLGKNWVNINIIYIFLPAQKGMGKRDMFIDISYKGPKVMTLKLIVLILNVLLKVSSIRRDITSKYITPNN